MRSSDRFGWLGGVIDGKYAVRAVAGEGNFGVVYHAQHLGLNAPIAVKCLKVPAGLRADQKESMLASLRSEALILFWLSKRTAGITQALDVGAAESPTGEWTPYLVMEWLEGETLEAHLDARRDAATAPLGLARAVELLSPAAMALAIAHQENVSHRDVKPSNLFLVKTRDGVTMKVVDFGIAKVFDTAPTVDDVLVQTRLTPGVFTPRYGAPEQWRPRSGATGPWTDVFAMALVLIEVATGRPALRGQSDAELCTTALDEDALRVVVERCDDALPEAAEVMERALSVSPALRYKDLGEMWGALKAALRGSRVPSAPRSATEEPSARTEHEKDTFPRALLSQPGAAESRICTVMMVDLAPLLQRLDPEDVEHAFARCVAIIAEQVESMGGFAEPTLGDGAVGVFGAPRSTDNDAERAVLAALGVQAALARASLPRSPRAPQRARPAPRIGIDTGRVVASAQHGSAPRKQIMRGDAVNVAARLPQTAEEGAIVISRDTYRQVQGIFNVEPLAPVRVAGHREALPAYRVVGRMAIRDAVPSFDFYGINTKLEGRELDMRRLTEALNAVVQAREARLVTLTGPPGIGRSRLLAELTSAIALRREPFLVLAAQCSPLSADTSYALAAALIRRRFRIDEADDAKTARVKLRRGWRWFAARAAANKARTSVRERSIGRAGPLVDEALEQVAIVLESGRPSQRDAVLLAPDEERNPARDRICAAIAHLLSVVAARVPVVVICDDIQWADHASLDLLNDLMQRTARCPVLVVCSARTELYERRPHWGEGQPGHERIVVDPLASRHVEQMILERMQRARDVPAELVQRLTELADGNPLVVQEILHLLVDLGIIDVRTSDAWAIHKARLDEVVLPATIEGIVQARLDRLAPEPRAVLTRAAVVGRTFWAGAVDRLRVVEGVEAWRSPTTALLAELREKQLIRAKEVHSFRGERDYAFAESAMREGAYRAGVRRSLHLAVAAWLEEQQGGASLSLIAHHYAHGGNIRSAAASYAAAAREAVAVGDDPGALRHFGRARDLLDASEGDQAREGGGDRPPEDARVASWQDRVKLRLDLGDVLRRQGRLDEAEQAYEDARTRILRQERRRDGSLTREEILCWDARVDYHVALTRKLRGATVEAQELVERAIERITDGGALAEAPVMYALLALLVRRGPRPNESLDKAREGLRIFRREAATHGVRRPDEMARLLLGLAAALYARRRMISAERTYRQIERVIRDVGHPDILGRALNGIAATRIARGDLVTARDMFLRALDVKQGAGDRHQIAVGFSNLAEVELRLGDVEAALADARDAVQIGEQINAGSDLADMYRNFANASLAAGQLDAALETGQKALAAAAVAGRVYIHEVGQALHAICAEVVRSAHSDADLRARAETLAKALSAVLAEHETDNRLRLLLDQVTQLLRELAGKRGDPERSI